MRLRKLTLSLTALTAISLSTIAAPITNAAELTIDQERSVCTVTLNEAEKEAYIQDQISAERKLIAAAKTTIAELKKAIPNAAADIDALINEGGKFNSDLHYRIDSEAQKVGFKEGEAVLIAASFGDISLTDPNTAPEDKEISNEMNISIDSAKSLIGSDFKFSSMYMNIGISDKAKSVLKPVDTVFSELYRGLRPVYQACADNKPGSYSLTFTNDDDVNPGDDDTEKPSNFSSGSSFGSS